MAGRLWSVVFDANDRIALGRFWAAALEWEYEEHDGWSSASAPNGSLPRLEFVHAPNELIAPNRIHFDLSSSSLDDQQDTVERLLGLGARHLDIGQEPDSEHVVLADPEGNEFCVIEPGNAFLAGCGFLGELACDGSREAGLFWSEALGWPLVWDQGQETAIQSPHGGTKVAWGGPPAPPKELTDRQRFDLTPAGGDRGAEVDRLVSLGATRLEVRDDGAVVLADPDGNEFRVRAT